MCGIAGEIDFRENNKTDGTVYDNMVQTLSPRGPDAQGLASCGAATLLHSRLAVVDIQGGVQPMNLHHQETDYTLVYNGELYNTEEIRKDLLNYGYNFTGHSDTEVVLSAYVQWGEGCLARFNGIFAFAIWNHQEESLFFARDRMGVKPLFYAQVDGLFLFASEIKALLAHPSVPPQVRRSDLVELLLLSPGRKQGNCVFAHITEVKPATCGVYSKEGLSEKPYWSLTDRPCSLNLEDATWEVKRLVMDAVERQVQCDVPVCSFLSGGLDSSILTTLAAEVLDQEGVQLHTFSVDYKDNDKHFTPTHFSPSQDNYYINLVSKASKTKHHTVVLDTTDLVDALFSAVEARDVPGMADVDSSLYLFCKEVKEHATVALSGECADELFGGYPWFRDKDIREQSGFPWAQNTDYRLSFIKKELQPVNSDFIQKYYDETLSHTHKLPDLSPLESRMKEMTRLNTDWFMQTLLERKDRMSMAHGLEVRVPFCDYRIAELMYAMPWCLKEFNGKEKAILRHSMKGILPEEVLYRKKSPYPKTWNPSYRQAVSKLLEEIIHDENAPLLQILSKDALAQLLSADNAVPWYGQLMTTPQTIAFFVQMNHWLSHYHIEIVD